MSERMSLEPVFGSELGKDLVEVWHKEHILGVQDVTSLFLIAEGLKPAGSLGFVATRNGGEGTDPIVIEAFEKDILRIENLLRKNNLCFHLSREELDRHVPLAGFTVARDQAVLDACVAQTVRTDAREGSRERVAYYKAIGTLFGFPATAVKEYSKNGERMEYEDLPRDIAQSELGRFARNTRLFILSKDHWQEELEVVAQWASCIQQRAPLLYKAILQERF